MRALFVCSPSGFDGVYDGIWVVGSRLSSRSTCIIRVYRSHAFGGVSRLAQNRFWGYRLLPHHGWTEQLFQRITLQAARLI